MANLAAAGIATVPAIDSTAAQVPVSGAAVLSVTSWQADNMAREVTAGGGVTGADLDAAVSMSGAPALSDILGAWSSAALDPAALAASRLLGKPDWGDSRDVVFPTEVLALFVGDALQHATTQTATTLPGQSQPAQSSAAGADYIRDPHSGEGGSHVVSARNAAFVPASLVTAPCSAISGFFNTILDTVFNALKLNPDDVAAWVSGKLGGGVVGTVLGGLAGWAASWWNHAVDTVESGLKSILGALTQPVLNVLRIAIGAVATFTMVVSYLKAWTASVTSNPPANRFAVGNEADRTGTFTVGIDTNAEIADWPSQLVDCAQVLHITLPTLSKAGLPVTWAVLPETGLVTVDTPSGPPFVGTLAADLTSQLAYTTGREDAKTAKGTLVSPTVTATVRVRRTEVDQLRALVTGFVTGQIPGILQPVVNPILASYIELATEQLDKLVGVDGAAALVVTHHVVSPPKPTPSPSVTTPPPSSASNQPINVCTLMPQGTVSGIVGHPVGAPDSEIGGFSPLQSECSYGFDDATIIYIPDNVSWCRQVFSIFAEGENYRTVPGVGDQAGYSTTNGLVAFFGTTCIQTFNEYKIDRDFSLSADIALMQAFRARL